MIKSFQFFTKPAAAIRPEAQRQQASLLAGLTAAMLPLALILVIIWVLVQPDFRAAPYISSGVISTVALTYALSRTRYHRIGAFILVFLLFPVVGAILITTSGPRTEQILVLNFLIVPILLASILLSVRAAVVMVILSFVFTSLFFYVSGVSFGLAYYYVSFLVVVSALLILTTIIRNKQMTARQEAEIALRESEARYRLVVNNVKEAIFQTDAQGLWTFLNPAWTEITGFPVEESLGQLFLNYVYPEDRQRNQELFAPLIAREKDYYRHEIRYLTKEGGFRWIEVYARLGLNEADKVIGTYGTLMDITDRKCSEVQLKRALVEKEVLLKEVHHRVKNNLQIVRSLLDLQAGQCEDSTERATLTEISQRVRSMALIHEQLYQAGGDLAHIEFGGYLRRLTTYLFSSYRSSIGSVQLKLNVSNATLSLDTAIPCGLIVNELVSNALKHAFNGRQDGVIEVTFLQNDENQYVLSIRNTGVPFPPDLAERLDSQGLSAIDSPSLGMQIIDGLISQIDGRLEMVFVPATHFTITFPA